MKSWGTRALTLPLTEIYMCRAKARPDTPMRLSKPLLSRKEEQPVRENSCKGKLKSPSETGATLDTRPERTGYGEVDEELDPFVAPRVLQDVGRGVGTVIGGACGHFRPFEVRTASIRRARRAADSR